MALLRFNLKAKDGKKYVCGIISDAGKEEFNSTGNFLPVIPLNKRALDVLSKPGSLWIMLDKVT